MRRVDVAVIGGGPAGAIVAALIAEAGRKVVVLERSAEPRWRACGVFSSPATVAALRRAGVDAAAISAVSRPIPAMRVETPRGTSFRLTYGDDGSLRSPAVGFDRPALDEALLRFAEDRGVEIRRATPVGVVRLGGATTGPRTPRSTVVMQDGEEVEAAIVIGADGPKSRVARAAGVALRPPLGMRIGLTYHVRQAERADGSGAGARVDKAIDARLVVLDGAYCGIAPVPRGRLNIGIVLASAEWRARLATEGAAAVAAAILASVPPGPASAASWRDAAPLDEIAGASPLGHRVRRRSGAGWLLVGDAAGFLDPFTGEGLHRAVVSAELAAGAAIRALDGRSRALDSYERAMRSRFATKDVVSVVVQAFVAHPATFEYAARRLARRERVRETMSLVMGDLVPARRALDPRFLAALLRP